MNIQLIESVTESGTDWGISLNGPNPESNDYFQMVNKEEAERLYLRLSGDKYPCIA